MSHKLLQNLACHKGAEHLTGPLNYNAHFKFLYTNKYHAVWQIKNTFI